MAVTLKIPGNGRDHFIGPLEAPVTLVEYGDLEGPDCARALSVIDKLLQEFNGSLCFIFRHYPETDLHQGAALASLALEAAGMQRKFWEMYRLILQNQKEITAPSLIEMAVGMGLDAGRFISDLEQENFMKKIEDDVQSGIESGVEGTPSFYLNGILMEYPTNYDILRNEIVSLLHENELSP